MADLLTGKTCLITGATDGLGKVTAQALAQMGAMVLLVGRNSAKGAAVADEIREITGNGAVEVFTADLSLMAEVQRLADEVKAKHPQLHVLVNNVGAIFPKRQVTREGLEMTLALNHLGGFFLTQLLLDTLKASTPARIVNVSSEAHKGERLDFGDLQLAHGYSVYKAYGRSKLANILFTYELARRLAGSGVTANALNPGLARTRFTQNLNLNALERTTYGLFLRINGISPEQGAQTIIYLASAIEVEGVSGKFWEKSQAIPSSPASYDETSSARLWTMSEQLITETAGAALASV